MSERLKACFEKLSSEGRKALLPYIVAGDPDPSMTVGFMNALVESGASIIELGMPFSDPMADGPSNQMGHERALKNSISTGDIFRIVAEFRQTNTTTPVVLMGYLNPVEVFGYRKFAEEAAKAGVDAMLIVDLPPEEAGEFKEALAENEMDLIFLIAPTTTKTRIRLICEQASGFLYYVSLKGVTGAGHLDTEEVNRKITEIREATDLPVNVGFGIKDGKSAASLAAVADGVVVGSKLVDQCASGDQQKIKENLSAILKEIREAMDA